MSALECERPAEFLSFGNWNVSSKEKKISVGSEGEQRTRRKVETLVKSRHLPRHDKVHDEVDSVDLAKDVTKAQRNEIHAVEMQQAVTCTHNEPSRAVNHTDDESTVLYTLDGYRTGKKRA